MIEAELGKPPEELFVEWDPQPLASASIGQVHRAVVVDPQSGLERAVAVKVQYPGVGDAIAADLRNADLLGALLRQGFGGLDPDDMVAEIKERITGELDYALEATNQHAFADHYRGHPFIHVPDVLPSLSTARVLTTELVTGATWAEALTWDQDERDQIGECLFRFVFRSLYGMHLFNGDPHPGNYLFHGDGRVTFLDFGLVKRFTDAETATFVGDGAGRCVRARLHGLSRDPRGGRHAARRSAGRRRGGRRVLQPVLRERAHRRHDHVVGRVRQPHRAPHVRPHQPDLAVRDRATSVRLHPAHQPGPVRAARRAARHRQLPAHGRRAVAVRAGTSQHADGQLEQPWLARHRAGAGDTPDADSAASAARSGRVNTR